ncbi:MAG: hypothetical protein C0622_12820 [Desulfuromonas sp.]|nr:MAG: hypothetical protein C0622_12820 [Desulfuromonas sp.]
MKKLLVIITLLLVATCVYAAEKKTFSEIAVEDLTKETQALAKRTSTPHVALTWWIPYEYWQVSMSNDPTTSNEDKKAILDALSGVSLLAVVQADISKLGAFTYYTKEETEKNLQISVTGPDAIEHAIAPMQSINQDLEALLGILKPLLGGAMGNLGSNLHFYVLDDQTKGTGRCIDPYKKGFINIQLAQRNGSLINTELELPLNSLYVPRVCPNGKEAHISWKYCPWSGKQLPE